MNITQQLCCPGAAENQDYIRLGEDIAMVVDGSTPLVKDPRVPEVREYVRLLADAVASAEGEDLPHMVAAGIETLRRRCGVPPEAEGVSAALAILRETGEQVEVFVLGDCAARGTLPGRAWAGVGVSGGGEPSGRRCGGGDVPSAPGARYRRHRGTAAAGGARDAAAAPADDEPAGRLLDRRLRPGGGPARHSPGVPEGRTLPSGAVLRRLFRPAGGSAGSGGAVLAGAVSAAAAAGGGGQPLQPLSPVEARRRCQRHRGGVLMGREL